MRTETNPARTTCDRTPHPPSAQDIVNQVFAAVRGAAVAGANQITQWGNEVRNAANKTGNDFAGCPSNAAQQTYDTVKSDRAKAQAVRDQARQQDEAAKTARQNCSNQTGGSPLCNAAYNELPFAGQAVAAQAVMDAADAALNSLRALKCVAGCGSQAKVVVPTVTAGPFVPVKLGGQEVQVCSQWSGGKLTAHLEASASASVAASGGTQVKAVSAGGSAQGGMMVSGKVSGGVDADIPKCERTETVKLPAPGYCAWKVDVLLPHLKNLKLVPPEVTPADVKVNVPSKQVKYVSGVTTGQCSQQTKVCTGVSPRHPCGWVTIPPRSRSARSGPMRGAHSRRSG